MQILVERGLRWQRSLRLQAVDAALVIWFAVALAVFTSLSNSGIGQYELHGLYAAQADFARGDWFVEETASYHPLNTRLVALAATQGILEQFLFAKSLLGFLATLAAAVVLLRGLTSPRLLVVPMTLLLMFGVQNTWGSQALDDVWHGLAVLSLALMLTGRRGLAVLLASIAFYGHFSVGVWLFGLLGLLLLHDVTTSSITWPRAWRFMLGIVVISMPLALWAWNNFSSDVPAGTFDLLFRVRSPHHYSFLDFGARAHVSASVVIMLGLYAEALTKPLGRRLRTLIIAMVTVQLLGLFFLEIVSWPLYVRIFPYRVSPWLLFMTIALVLHATSRSDLRPRQRLVTGVGAVILLVFDRPGILTAIVERSGLLVVLAAVAVIVEIVLRRGSPWPRLHTHLLHATVLVSAAAFVYLGVQSSQSSPAPEFSAGGPSIAAAFAEHVDVGEIMLTPPDQTQIRQISRRGIVVDFKTFPMGGEEMLEWQERIERVAGIPLRSQRSVDFQLQSILDDSYHSRRPEDLFDVAADYGASFIVVRKDSLVAREILASGRTAATVQDWILVRVPELERDGQ